MARKKIDETPAEVPKAKAIDAQPAAPPEAPAVEPRQPASTLVDSVHFGGDAAKLGALYAERKAAGYLLDHIVTANASGAFATLLLFWVRA